MIGLYQHRDSIIHKTPAGAKLGLLLCGGTTLFFLQNIPALLFTLIGVVLLYPLARLSPKDFWSQLKIAWLMLFCVFVVQWAFSGILEAIASVVRLATLLFLASWVTLSTRSSDLIDAVLPFLRPLEYLGVDTDKIALLLSLTVTYIPLLFTHYQQLRDAQRARCIDPTLFALLVPLLVQVLKMADQLAEAIDARAFHSN